MNRDRRFDSGYPFRENWEQEVDEYRDPVPELYIYKTEMDWDYGETEEEYSTLDLAIRDDDNGLAGRILDLDPPDEYKIDGLKVALQRNNNVVADWIFSSGIPFDPDYMYDTVDEKTMRTLIKHGANKMRSRVLQRNIKDTSAFILIIESGPLTPNTIIDLINKYRGSAEKIKYLYRRYPEYFTSEMVNALLTKVNMYDHNAVAAVQFLISIGGDINTENGILFLHAGIASNYEVVKLVILMGINTTTMKDDYHHMTLASRELVSNISWWKHIWRLEEELRNVYDRLGDVYKYETLNRRFHELFGSVIDEVTEFRKSIEDLVGNYLENFYHGIIGYTEAKRSYDTVLELYQQKTADGKRLLEISNRMLARSFV
jgi:hypothetical protein